MRYCEGETFILVYPRYESRGDLGPKRPGLPLSGMRRIGVSTDGGVGATLGSAEWKRNMSRRLSVPPKNKKYVAKLPRMLPDLEF